MKRIFFVKAGEYPTLRVKLTLAFNQRLETGGREYIFGKVPKQISITLRPNLILWSTEIKQKVLIEMTILWKGNGEAACERKLEKYQEQVEQCKYNKWRTVRYRSWLPGFRRKIFMLNSESTRYDRRKKKERPPSNFRIGGKSVKMVMD